MSILKFKKLSSMQKSQYSQPVTASGGTGGIQPHDLPPALDVSVGIKGCFNLFYIYFGYLGASLAVAVHDND